MLPLIVIRPQPGCDATATAAAALGLAAHGFPLFSVIPQDWEPPAADSFDALLIGSVNALRHGGAALSAYAGMPAYAVGTATAQAARLAGLDVVATGNGGLQDLLDRIGPGHRRLLRLAGRDRVALTVPAGRAMTERVVYASEPLAMPRPLADLLRCPALVMLHSAGAAGHFAAECARLGLDRAVITLATIGPRVAQAAGTGWAAVHAAPSPDDKALLAMAGKLCQTPARPQ